MKIKLYLYHEQWAYDKDAHVAAWHVLLDDEVNTSRVRIKIGECEVDIPEDIKLLTEQEVKQIMVDGFKKEKEELQAETFVKIKAIDDKIQQLLCIELKQGEE
jgi:hypothetical protein